MADFNPTENIPLDDFEQNDEYDDEWNPPTQETPFFDGIDVVPPGSELPDVPEIGTDIRERENTEAMNVFYESLKKEGWNVDILAPLQHNGIFVKDPTTKQVFLKYKGKNIRLTSTQNPNKFLALSTIQIQFGKGGTAFIRDVLGVNGYGGSGAPKLSSEQRQTLNEIASETVESPDLPEQIEMQRVETVEQQLTDFLEAGTQTDFALGSLPYRELAGLDRSLRNIRTSVQHLIGEREAKKVKVRELKSNIEGEDVPIERRKEIQKLEEQIKIYETEIREYDNKFRSQFERIKQTINKMLNEDLTLGERVRTLFREQGITIASILTAFGLAISTIVSSITSAIPKPKPKPKPDPKPDPGPDPGPSPKPEPGWIKNQLKKIADLLLKLADKMLVALPGIIGSIVNFVLKSASAAVGFIAQNLWLLILAIGGILYNYITTLKIIK